MNLPASPAPPAPPAPSVLFAAGAARLEREAQLAGRVRRVLGAANTVAAARLAVGLARGGVVERAAVAGHAKCPPELAVELLASPGVARRVAGARDTSAVGFERLLCGGPGGGPVTRDVLALAFAADNPHLPAGVRDGLAAWIQSAAAGWLPVWHRERLLAALWRRGWVHDPAARTAPPEGRLWPDDAERVRMWTPEPLMRVRGRKALEARLQEVRLDVATACHQLGVNNETELHARLERLGITIPTDSKGARSLDSKHMPKVIAQIRAGVGTMRDDVRDVWVERLKAWGRARRPLSALSSLEASPAGEPLAPVVSVGVSGRLILAQPALHLLSDDPTLATKRFVEPDADNSVFVHADVVAMEVLVAGAVAGEESLLGLLARGEDVYLHVAGERLRKIVKIAVLAWLYGARDRGLSAILGGTVAEARMWRLGLESAFPALAALRDRMEAEAAATGWVTLPNGRAVSCFDDKGEIAPRIALNRLIQGLAADLLHAMCVNWERRTGRRPTLTCHDAIDVACPVTDRDATAGLLVEAMTTNLPGWAATIEDLIRVELSWGATLMVGKPLQASLPGFAAAA